MRTLDLSQPFIKLIAEAQKDTMGSNLSSNLIKVTAQLKSYATSFHLTLEELSLLHIYICTGGGATHPGLEKHVKRLRLTDGYKGQHLLRLTKFIRALLRPKATDNQSTLELLPLGEQPPEPLRTIWPYLPRPATRNMYARYLKREAYSARISMASPHRHNILPVK